MSLSMLPEERIQDILSHLLCVPHRVFNRRGRWRPEPTHQVLQVCKLWLRVGTPLLYECLVLTTSSHAASVARLFRAHPHAALAVRCLKLQGEFGPELRAVVQFLPQRLASVYVLMSLADRAGGAADGLLLALPALNPGAVYLQGRLGQPHTAMVQRVDKTLADLIHSGTWALNDAYYVTDTLAAALAASPTLRRLVIDPYYLLVRAFLAKVGVVAMNPGLREVACVPGGQTGTVHLGPVNLQEIFPRERNEVVRERLRRLLTFPQNPEF